MYLMIKFIRSRTFSFDYAIVLSQSRWRYAAVWREQRAEFRQRTPLVRLCQRRSSIARLTDCFDRNEIRFASGFGAWEALLRAAYSSSTIGRPIEGSVHRDERQNGSQSLRSSRHSYEVFHVSKSRQRFIINVSVSLTTDRWWLRWTTRSKLRECDCPTAKQDITVVVGRSNCF